MCSSDLIAAELNQHPARLVLLKQRWQASQPLLRGIAADAGVHHRRFRLPLLIEQRRPGGVGRHPIASAQAVAEDQQRVRRHRAAGKQEQQQERHMPAENILEVHHLKKSVGQGEHQLSILTGVELVVKPRQTIALIGESGSGKSTLLAILAGLDDGSSGEVSMLGKPLHRMDEEARAALRAQHVGFVFQSFMLIPTLNALENVELPALLRGASDSQSRGDARALLEQLGLGRRLHHLPAQLSGGEQQRVALARAFNGRPAILFADEPTGNLDRQTGDKIADLLFSLNREHGTTLILVTHDPLLAARCDRRLRLVDGQLREEA